MVSFLFWNIGGKPLGERVASLARSHTSDLVLLVECDTAPGEMLEQVNHQSPQAYYTTPTALDRITVLSRFPEPYLTTLEDDPHTGCTFRHLVLSSGLDLLLVVAHFPSKVHWKEESQIALCGELGHDIRRWEKKLGHARTVLIGDLNMNPFESGVVSSHGLHGVMTREIARRNTRTVRGRDFPFFYNPMWGHFGDVLDSVPGTYYYSKGEPVTYFWNMFDQVLLRPSLLEAFRHENLRIVDSDGTGSLLTPGGLPDASSASDHLPVVFALDL